MPRAMTSYGDALFCCARAGWATRDVQTWHESGLRLQVSLGSTYNLLHLSRSRKDKHLLQSLKVSCATHTQSCEHNTNSIPIQ